MRLPPEVIIEVISHLDTLDAPPTLANCSLTSWGFKCPAERMLYKRVAIWLGDHPDYWKYVACIQTLSTTPKGALVREFSLDVCLPSDVPPELWPIDDICLALLAMKNLEGLSLFITGTKFPETFMKISQCLEACTFQLKQLSIQPALLDFLETGPWTDKHQRLEAIELLNHYIGNQFFDFIERLVRPHLKRTLCLFRHCRNPHYAAGGAHGAICAFPYLQPDATSWSAAPIREALGDAATFIPIFKIALAEIGDGRALEQILESVAEYFPRVSYLKLLSDVLSLDSDPRGIAMALRHLKGLRRLAVEQIHYRSAEVVTPYESREGRKRLAVAWSEHCPTLCSIRFPNFVTIRRESGDSESEWGVIRS